VIKINRRSPVNDDPKLAATLERLITQFKNDDTLRVASPRQQATREAVLNDRLENPDVAAVRLERILGGNDLTDISYLSVGVARARSVGRVVIRRAGRTIGYGTGFLVAPGVLLTNRHVLESTEMVRESSVQFRYERDAKGADLDPVEFAFRVDPQPIIDVGLDMAIVRVDSVSSDGKSLDTFGWMRLNPTPGKAFVGEYLTIIQHPGGERKQVCVRENKLLKYDDESPFMWYETDTVGGSSGSPAFNGSWDVVALHHSSVPRTKKKNGRDVWLAKDGSEWQPEMGDDTVDWIANEGVRVSRICDFLGGRFPDHPLSRAVREAVEVPLETVLGDTDGAPAHEGVRVTTDRGGNTRVFLPIEIGIQMSVGGGANRRESTDYRQAIAASPSPGARLPAITVAQAVEAVAVDQTNYDERNGYDPKFLGGEFVVPLPKVSVAAAKAYGEVVTFARQQAELRYYNYSVVINKPRRLAYFSAANIDPRLFKGERDKAGDKWFTDPRILESVQTGKDFYKKQKTFEADRTTNPFDQGHLTSRGNLQWGATETEAKRNGDDSFHYTNCSPQHWQFNQNNSASGLWFRLEVSAVETLSRGGRICILNGPVFDAPMCKKGADGKLCLNLAGKRVKDRTFGGLKIPKQFFKLIAYKDSGKLRAKAFVVTQEDLLEDLDRLHEAELSTLTDVEVRLYQVTVADLEKLTGLKFGVPQAADTHHEEELFRVKSGVPIESERELFLV
jgi:endonuclease G